MDSDERFGEYKKYPDTNFRVLSDLLLSQNIHIYRDDGENIWFTREDPKNVTRPNEMIQVPKEQKVTGLHIAYIQKQSRINEYLFLSLLYAISRLHQQRNGR